MGFLAKKTNQRQGALAPKLQVKAARMPARFQDLVNPSKTQSSVGKVLRIYAALSARRNREEGLKTLSYTVMVVAKNCLSKPGGGLGAF